MTAEFTGSRGKIHYGHWTPAEPQALVVFFHGLGEHIGSYEALAGALTNAGFAVWALDHAGERVGPWELRKDPGERPTAARWRRATSAPEPARSAPR
ncbi:alpha/beta hydrolase [Amycolatopsis sp. Hca4]|uniref:serine aminopeptidase domain-containing protein n=2 Tax=unclassified Amycolatopsis TaxID=2618356 RepID=UPI0020CAE9E7|nr:alpha/beta hydrolase [Amycolatopsis sp. Hca4]